MPTIASVLLSLSWVLGLFGVVAGKAWLWDKDAVLPFPSQPHMLMLAGAILLAAILLARFRITSLKLEPAVICTGLVLVFISDWLCRNYSYYQGPGIRGEILLGAMVFVYCLRKAPPKFYNWFALSTSALCLLCFFVQSSGRPLISDDHSTFIFRLELLKENFPFIPLYHPLWNAGMDARDFFATGVLNAFFLFAPLLYSFEVLEVYNVIITAIVFVLLPLSVYLAAKIEKLEDPIPALAATLAVCSGLTWYDWALKYGTLGFVTMAALLPLTFALCVKLLRSENSLNRWEAAALVAGLTLMLLWAPAAVIFAPAALIALINRRALLRKKYFFSMAFALLVLNTPQLAMLWSVSKVHRFLKVEAPAHELECDLPQDSEALNNQNPAQNCDLSKEKQPEKTFKHKSGGINLKKSLKVIRETGMSANPLILFLGLPGLFLLASRSRLLWGLSAAWLLFLGSVIVPIKPQLEFDRMLVLLLLLLSIPTGTALSRLMSANLKSYALPFCAVAVGFFLSGPFSLGSLVLNRTLIRYSFSTGDLEDLSQAVKQYGGPGRVLFSGFVLHEMDHGHLAPLSMLTEKPLMASSPFHNLWTYTDAIPKSFLDRADAGVEEYLDLFNVTSVFAHNEDWIRYFQSHPEKYRSVYTHKPFTMYQRETGNLSYFLSGQGEVTSQDDNSITLKLASPEAVLKFNYFPFLESSACKISGKDVGANIVFIRLDGCPVGQEIKIRSVGPFRRLAVEWSKAEEEKDSVR